MEGRQNRKDLVKLNWKRKNNRKIAIRGRKDPNEKHVKGNIEKETR